MPAQMHQATITLPQLLLTNKQNDLELTLRSSLTLLLPREHQGLKSSAELLQATTKDQLWIARMGCCSLTITFTTFGEPLALSETKLIANWIQEQDVWSRLGLRLVSSNDQRNTLTFSIQHPDLSSALIAPDNALTAEFQAATCEIDVSSTEFCEQVESQHIRPSKRQKKESETEQDEIYQSLDSDDRKAIEDYMSNLRQERAKGTKIKAMAMRQRPIDDIATSQKIIDAAITLLLFGGGKQCTGFSVFDGRDMPGLTQLAPGVFHFPYLKVVSEKANLMSTISTSLARMAKAESPSLRQKVANSRIAAGKDLPIDERTIQGIEKGIWELLLKHTKIPRVPMKRRLQAAAEHSGSFTIPSPGHVSRSHSRTLELWDSPLPSTPSMFASPGSSQPSQRSQSRTLELFDDLPEAKFEPREVSSQNNTPLVSQSSRGNQAILELWGSSQEGEAEPPMPSSIFDSPASSQPFSPYLGSDLTQTRYHTGTPTLRSWADSCSPITPISRSSSGSGIISASTPPILDFSPEFIDDSFDSILGYYMS